MVGPFHGRGEKMLTILPLVFEHRLSSLLGIAQVHQAQHDAARLYLKGGVSQREGGASDSSAVGRGAQGEEEEVGTRHSPYFPSCLNTVSPPSFTSQ